MKIKIKWLLVLVSDNTAQLLSFLHLVCYSANMIFSEKFYPEHIDLFTYAILKHIIGHCFYIFFPIVVISMKKEFREELKRVFQESKGSNGELSKEEKLKEISKEMLNLGS